MSDFDQELTPKEARRVCGWVFFNAGENGQRVLLTAVTYDWGMGIPSSLTFRIDGQPDAGTVYSDVCGTCERLGIESDDIIVRRAFDGRLFPGRLTRLAYPSTSSL